MQILQLKLIYTLTAKTLTVSEEEREACQSKVITEMQKEIVYLKELVKEKDKIIRLLEKKK